MLFSRFCRLVCKLSFLDEMVSVCVCVYCRFVLYNSVRSFATVNFYGSMDNFSYSVVSLTTHNFKFKIVVIKLFSHVFSKGAAP